MYCPHCGSPVAQGSSFCSACGKEIKSFLSKANANVPAAKGEQPPEPAAPKQAATNGAGDFVSKTDEQKKKFLFCARAEVVSAALAFLSVLLLLFVPLFVNDYTTIVDEERVVKSKKESLFVLCVKSLKTLLKNDLESFVLGFGILRLIVVVYAVVILYFVVKDFAVKISHLVKFDDYYDLQTRQSAEAERTQELMKQLKLKNWGDVYGYIISELVILFLFGGYDKIFFGGVVFVGVVMLLGYVVGKVAKTVQNKLKKQNRQAA